ncbi:MAG: hypothetical protein ACLRXQ_01690 [Phascolarctobacterium faecium]
MKGDFFFTLPLHFDTTAEHPAENQRTLLAVLILIFREIASAGRSSINQKVAGQFLEKRVRQSRSLKTVCGTELSLDCKGSHAILMDIRCPS